MSTKNAFVVHQNFTIFEYVNMSYFYTCCTFFCCYSNPLDCIEASFTKKKKIVKNNLSHEKYIILFTYETLKWNREKSSRKTCKISIALFSILLSLYVGIINYMFLSLFCCLCTYIVVGRLQKLLKLF